MTITLRYTGQLAHLAGASRETLDVAPGTRLDTVIEHILERHGPAVAPFFRDPRGGLPPTLLVICDGQQLDGDRTARDISGAGELMFMSPIAGG